MTEETKQTIKKLVFASAEEIAEIVHLGLTEDMSPNDIEFYPEYRKLIDEAQDYWIECIQQGCEDE